MSIDYDKTLSFWERRGRSSTADRLNVTMLRDRLPELARFIHRCERRQLRAHLKLSKDMVLLDLGCGNGRLTLEFARRCGHVVAVDFSPALLDQAREAARRHGIGNVTWVQCSAPHYHPDRRFNAIMLGGLLPYLADADLPPLLRRLHDALAPGGVLVSRDSVLSDLEPEAPPTPADYEAVYRRRDDYRRLFDQAGFTVLRSGEFYAFPTPAYVYDRLLPPSVKSAAIPRLVLAGALRIQELIDPIQRRLPWLNRMLAGRRNKIVQQLTVCRRSR